MWLLCCVVLWCVVDEKFCWRGLQELGVLETLSRDTKTAGVAAAFQVASGP